ncbi:response regulator transcription factor [Acidobacteriia bacterium AH_259_A11_L15]|nr:response regulator transcription factor [Acidobacteriia bacterium AH_259_A11_L15]
MQYTQVITAEADFRFVGEGERFQVGVFDGELDCLEAGLTFMRLKFPSMRPLLVSSNCDDKECLRWLFRGMCGLLSYDRYEKELPRAVRHLAVGQFWFPARVVHRWMQVDAARRASALCFPLSSREREVMEFLFRRFSNKETAHILGISERTVKFHVGNILEKLHMNSREELSATWVPNLGLV